MSGPLWRGPLQEVAVLEQLVALEEPGSELLAPASRRLLQRLQADDGMPAEASDLSDLARRLQDGPPKLKHVLARLQQSGWRAQASGIAPGQFRTDAPWPEVFAAAKAG